MDLTDTMHSSLLDIQKWGPATVSSSRTITHLRAAGLVCQNRFALTKRGREVVARNNRLTQEKRHGPH